MNKSLPESCVECYLKSKEKNVICPNLLLFFILIFKNISHTVTDDQTKKCSFAGKWESDLGGHNMTLNCENKPVGMISGKTFDDSGKSFILTGRYRKHDKNYYVGIVSVEPGMVRGLTGVFMQNEQTIKASYQMLVKSNTVNIQKNTLKGDETYTRIK